MSRSAGKVLSDEDRVLWSLVAHTATPLRGRRPAAPVLEPVARPSGPDESSLEEQPAKAVPANPPLSPAPLRIFHSLDRQTMEKLAKGRVPIEGRVDLHGMTQSEAYRLLLSFLERARAQGARYVLVITGKGSTGEGVLRRQVPAWLSTPPFRALVSSHDNAARQHGGGGALYLRLRRGSGGRQG